MGLLRGKKEDENQFNYETNDLLIVFDDDNRTSDIQVVTDFSDNAVTGETYKVPLEDCEITTGRDGRNFFYRAPAQSIKETHRLAELERNMVLTQITAYRPPVHPASIDWVKGLLIALIFIAFIVLGFVAS